MRQRILWLLCATLAVQWVQAQTRPSKATVLNVRNYGCAGNGIKDDSACIVAAGRAVVAAAANGPVDLYFPAGRYLINPLSGMIPYKPGDTGTVFLDFQASHANNITIRGEGRTSQLALLSYTASAHSDQPYNEQVSVASGRIFYFWAFRFAGNNEAVMNMTFDGNGQSYGANACKGTSSDPNGCFWFSGIVNQGKKSLPLENLKVSNNAFIGISGWPVLANNTSHVRISNNTASESEGMVCANGSSDCIIDGNTSNNSHDAPYACNGGTEAGQQVSGCVISNNSAESSNNGAGIDVTATWNATVSGNRISGAANWCIQVDRSGGAYLGGSSKDTLASQDIKIIGNTCVRNNHWEGWPFNGEIMIGDQYRCPKSGDGSCRGVPWTPGSTAKNVTVTGNHCVTGNAWGTCVAVGYGAENVEISGNDMTGCGSKGPAPRSIWVDGGASTSNVTVGRNALQDRTNSSCAGLVYKAR